MTAISREKPMGYCLYCREPFELKRNDKKFCHEACRTAFHNERRSLPQPVQAAEPEAEYRTEDHAAIKRINNILLQNRIILENLMGLYDGRLTLNDFYGFNVNLKYFSSEYKDDYYGYVFRMCYDYGYHIEGDIVYLIYAGGELYFN